MFRSAITLWMAMLVAAGGCASPRSGGFDSDVPGARIDEIEETVTAWRAAPPDQRRLSVAARQGLVESLRSEDPLVRLLAIEALAEITGERRGYRADDLPLRRAAAVETWVVWATEVES